ncbi:phosphatidylinositol-glycan biosynthesis class F protein [Macadamia integrifolia]|uniref:phosphatidylinositol-glycan biosynthesis class F protein n=1 Tax=Macadamia integrifolia TaxID=60698 RepID=UPI001C4E3D26|nr:phosphatidylinositol-glycan biosynthesis class F protein [Macadamia integrifolia]
MSPATTGKAETARNGEVLVAFKNAFLLHLVCGLGLAVAFWFAHIVYAVNLISDPAQTLYLIWVIECPLVIILYSLLRWNPEQCSFLKAVVRGLLGLPAGALLNTIGAIVLGAPVGSQYMKSTINWSLLMSLFTFVPAASVFGSSWKDWQRLFAYTKPTRVLDYMICIPAHGAAIGAWFGAWPMPLDWERPWQEWPICVTYGAVAGYLVGMVVSLGFTLIYGDRQQHVKGD